MKLIPLLIVFFIGGCAPTTTGNPVKQSSVNLQMQDQQPFAFMKYLSESLIPTAKAATGNVKFCFKRLRFKPDSTLPGAQNFELALGEVEILPGGTNLVTVSVPHGQYERVEFDLEKNCDGNSKPSVSFTNDLGSFSTEDNMTIKFDGVYVVSADGTLTLNVDVLFDAMDTVSDSAQIKVVLEDAVGDF